MAGLGKIGFRLVRDLVESGQPVVAIEHRARRPRSSMPPRDLVPVVLGNAKTPEVLVKAGAAGAKAVVAATDGRPGQPEHRAGQPGGSGLRAAPCFAYSTRSWPRKCSKGSPSTPR